jgi:nucleobase:cation symporter-1, NCS1 family
MSKIRSRDRRLYNKDLAPTDPKNKTWGWFEIFNVWANDVQSLFGYTLAASLFLTYGLNGWAVFLAILLAGFFIMWLVNLSGKPSVKLGIPYPVFARASMGVYGANFPAMVRGIVAMFWYGAQTYFASTAVALLLKALSGSDGGTDVFLGMNGIDWISFIFVAGFQVYLFWQGIDLIRKFLNFAGPAVYAVMILLMLIIWGKAGGNLLSEVGNIFSGVGSYSGGTFAAFLAIFGTMVAYFAAVVINFGDFSRFVKNEKEMKKGNLWGLPGNIFLFSFIALMVTAGTVSVFGETITNPTDMVARVGSLGLTVIAAFAFFAATIGINMVANFIPPAYDLANLMPSKINFRTGGLITSIVGFIIGALWVSFISKVGMFPFVNTLGAILAPVYGIMIVDYYVIKKERIDINQLFSSKKGGKYYYNDGWNQKAFVAWGIAGVFSILTVWHPSLSGLGGYAWIIGAALGTILHLMLSGKKNRR